MWLRFPFTLSGELRLSSHLTSHFFAKRNAYQGLFDLPFNYKASIISCRGFSAAQTGSAKAVCHNSPVRGDQIDVFCFVSVRWCKDWRRKWIQNQMQAGWRISVCMEALMGLKDAKGNRLSASDTYLWTLHFFGLHTLLLSACTRKYSATPQHNQPPLPPPTNTHADSSEELFGWLISLM